MMHLHMAIFSRSCNIKLRHDYCMIQCRKKYKFVWQRAQGMESAVQQRGILSLVEKLTDKSQDEIDEDATRRLKLVCKQGGSEVVGNVFRLLVDKLRTSNSKVREETSA